MDLAEMLFEELKEPNVLELQRVLGILRRRIAKREISPGTKLLEVALAEEFKISRVRVREVLLALEQRGLVERHSNRGAVVAKLTLQMVFDNFDVRESLEGLCVRLATEKVAPASWQDAVELFDGPMVRYATEGDFDCYLAEIDRFRSRTIEAADNLVLQDALDRIYDKARAIIERTIMLPGRIEIGLKQLQGVIAAMRAGDGELAEKLRRANIRSQREHAQRYQNYIL